MTKFRNLRIEQKLMVIIMLTSSAALVLAGFGIVISNSMLFREYLKRDLSALARIIADNSTAALAFDDPVSAAETLGALRAKPHVVNACIYRANGTMLAQYARSRTAAGCPAADTRDGIASSGGSITLTQSITLNRRRIGRLILVNDLGEIAERMKIDGATVLVFLLASGVIAFFLSSRLRTIVATPISQLAQAATSVSQTRDYSVRAQKKSNDELGILVDAFNQMLEGIQSRDGELTRALSELQRSNESLARSNEDLQRFAFIASHDLQEPLRMIAVYTQLLVRRYSGGPGGEITTFVENIVGGTRRMRELLDDLLAYTEIGTAPEQPFEAVDLNIVLEKVAHNLKVAIDDNQAIVTAGRMPVLSAHEAHFVALFQNLIGNAIKYRSEQPPRIDIATEVTDGWLRLAVADNGIGIDPQYHATIFVAFKRLHGKGIPGTGIGLAICQRVVERYGGRISVHSEPGHGATFVIMLPDTCIRRS
jgi:signal transduction histidine kinase